MESWRNNRLVFAVLALPPTAWLVIFFTVPLIIMWVYSFAERGPQGQINLAINFANYARAIEWIHLGIIWKSIWIAAVTTVITFMIGFPLAMGIAFALYLRFLKRIAAHSRNLASSVVNPFHRIGYPE